MRRTVTLAVDEAYIALATAAIVGASCPCGQPARRVTLERNPMPAKGRKSWDRDIVLGPDGIVVRSWCGRADDQHTNGESPYGGPDLDQHALALVEEDL